MAAHVTLKYLGNGNWLYKGEQGVGIVNAADQPVLNALVKEGGVALAETSATLADKAITVHAAKSIANKTSEGLHEEAVGAASKLAMGIGFGAIFTNPISGLAAGAFYGGALDNLKSNPNANLHYAHEFNFEGSPYYQESNFLKPPAEHGTSSEQQSTALREQFRRNETQDTNSLGPDGQPWGTPTRTSPNATTEWTRSPQPGQLLHTSHIQSGDNTETRITKSVDQARWQVMSEQVHERIHGVERLVSTTDTTSGKGWTLDRASGQMQPFTLDAEAVALARMAPAVQNHRALNNHQLQQCHRQEAEQMAQSMHSVYALATGQAASSGSNADNNETRIDPQQREQAIEAGMGSFRRATAELLSAREVMRARGMELPEVTDVPDLSRHRSHAQAQAPEKQTPELTALQQRHHQMAQNQLGPLLREHGHSPEQIERVSAAAVSHVQQLAHRGQVQTFLLSRDGASVAVLQESAPMSEFSVPEAQRENPRQHLERAQALAHEQGREREQAIPAQAHASPEVNSPAMARG
jgi:hypothetical protein